MTPAEYNDIIQAVNENAFERRIFLDIRADLERCGLDIRRIPYEHYLWLREERLRAGNTSSVIREIDSYEPPVSMNSPCIPEYARNGEEKQKRAKLSREEKRHIFGTFFVAGAMVAIGFMIPSISLIIWGFAFCVLLWGFKDDLPYPENYDTDYVQRYVKAQEDARLYTRAMMHQAYLHSGELKILNEKINGKK